LKVVKTYKYLGLDFEDTLRWTLTRQRLVAKAESGGGRMVVDDCACFNFGSELWGSAKCKEVEMVQLEVGRRLLGVSKCAVVRGELGWWSMRAQRDMKLLLYWARLVRLDDSRLVKQVYRSRREQAEKRISDWCSQNSPEHWAWSHLGL
jgi:hypothetical protein